MFDLICVTNRQICKGDFLGRIEEIAKCGTKGIILREKDLPKAKYKRLAKEAVEICNKYDVQLILHSFIDIAVELEVRAMHLPMHILRDMTDAEKKSFTILGASCHSAGEAIEAEKQGCSYIVAGHIFATDCKKGLEPRGITFLEDVCKAVSIPVYAIGGIDNNKIMLLKQAGAKGACLMSSLMSCSNPKEYLEKYTIQNI